MPTSPFFISMPAKKKIDPEEVRKLAAIGATVKEIADFLHCGHATIYRRFQRVLEEGRASGVLRAKGQIFRKAMDGQYASLQLYLANTAGWTDRPAVSITNTLVQNSAPQRSPEQVKAHLIELQKAIRAAALEQQPQLPPAVT